MHTVFGGATAFEREDRHPGTFVLECNIDLVEAASPCLVEQIRLFLVKWRGHKSIVFNQKTPQDMVLVISTFVLNPAKGFFGRDTRLAPIIKTHSSPIINPTGKVGDTKYVVAAQPPAVVVNTTKEIEVFPTMKPPAGEN
eukprot:scaffold14195_cov180-Cylindrotheca_fusiformis.AAC.1